MASKLDQLKSMTVVVADTGDIEAIRAFHPTDCTTNPSLILKAAQMPGYASILDEALDWGRRKGGCREAVTAAVADRLAVVVRGRAHAASCPAASRPRWTRISPSTPRPASTRRGPSWRPTRSAASTATAS